MAIIKLALESNKALVTGQSPIIQVSGLNMFVGDGSGFWKFSPKCPVIRRECLESGKQTTKATVADVKSSRGALVCSYGHATTWQRYHEILMGGQPKVCDLFVSMVGVPDLLLAQLYMGGLWHKPSFITRAVAFQCTTAFPVSCSFANPDTVIKFGDKIPNDFRVMTIDCNTLVSNEDPVERHKEMCNHPDVIALAEQLFYLYCQPLYVPQPQPQSMEVSA